MKKLLSLLTILCVLYVLPYFYYLPVRDAPLFPRLLQLLSPRRILTA